MDLHRPTRRLLLASLAAAALLTGCTPIQTAPPTPGPGVTPATGADGTLQTAQPDQPVDAHAAVQVAAAAAQLQGLPDVTRTSVPGYDREALFGPAWTDVDADGCGTRDQILARDLTDPATRGRCVVVAGQLTDPYTGTPITFTKSDAGAVQIDHVIPLSLAMQLGAGAWPQGKRVTFANDPINLLAVDGPTNQAKSDSGPDQWLPPQQSYRCTYVIHFTRAASAYGLGVTPDIRAAITDQLTACATVDGSPADLTPLPAALWDRAAGLGGGSSTPASSAVGPGDAAVPANGFPNCAAARQAGAAPLHRGDPGYRDGLDGDGDGTACE